MHDIPAIHLKKIWEDSDLIEVRLSAASEHFRGEVEVYATYDDIARVAMRLAGFPAGSQDRRDFEFCARRGGNSFVLTMEAADSTGHCWAVVKLVETERSREQAIVNVACEPAAIDEFARELEAVSVGRASSAQLRGVPAVSMWPPRT